MNSGRDDAIVAILFVKPVSIWDGFWRRHYIVSLFSKTWMRQHKYVYFVKMCFFHDCGNVIPLLSGTR